jgi:HPt (histidine-containing phosphotransfer) domain-containing protein
MRIDPQVVQTLVDAIGIDAAREIAKTLQVSLESFCQELPTMDAKTMAMRSHSLKGSLGYLGATELQALASKANTLAREEKDPRYILESICTLVPQTLTELEQVLAAYETNEQEIPTKSG